MFVKIETKTRLMIQKSPRSNILELETLACSLLIKNSLKKLAAPIFVNVIFLHFNIVDKKNRFSKQNTKKQKGNLYQGHQISHIKYLLARSSFDKGSPMINGVFNDELIRKSTPSRRSSHVVKNPYETLLVSTLNLSLFLSRGR